MASCTTELNKQGCDTQAAEDEFQAICRLYASLKQRNVQEPRTVAYCHKNKINKAL
jgi:hypothetical protein